MTKTFGLMAREPTGAALQCATKFATQDATATPKTSPLSYTSSTTTLTVPDNAVQLILAPSTDLRVSEDSGMARYCVVPANAAEAIPVAAMGFVYLKRDSADGTVSFRFTAV